MEEIKEKFEATDQVVQVVIKDSMVGNLRVSGPPLLSEIIFDLHFLNVAAGGL